MAASPAKLAANRRNGALSRGPKTDEGKAISSRNATKHGILSTEVLLPDENGEAFGVFAEGLREQLAPTGDLEGLLADRIISCAWRLRRTMAIEREVFVRELADADDIDADDELLGLRCKPKPKGNMLGLAWMRADSVERLNRYETNIERAMLRAMHELERIQARRRGQNISPPAVLDVALTVGMANPDEQKTSVQ